MNAEAAPKCGTAADGNGNVLSVQAAVEAHSGRTHSVATLCGLCVAVLFTFSGLLSSDRIPTYRDLLFFVLPFKEFLAEHLRRGQIPLWNPYTFLGTPFLASFQSGVFYPPSALLIVPFPLGFNLFLLAHYLIALGGIWCLLRSRDLGLAASAIGSLTFVVGGYLVSMLNVTNHLQSGVWAPWVMFLWIRYVATGRTSLLLTLTLVVAVQLLGGSPESLLMTLTLVAFWTLYHYSSRWAEMGRLAAALAGTMVLVAGLTAFQILPTAEYLQQSVREGALSYERASSWSTEPISLLQLLLPHSSTLLPDGEPNQIFTIFENFPPWISSIYLGVVPICLGISGAIIGRERRFWSTVLLVGLLLALGRHTPVLHALYAGLPQLFGKFRFPEKFYFFVHFAASILAAEGAEGFLRGNRAARRLATVSAVTFLAIAAVVLSVRWWRPMDFLWAIAILKGRFVYAEEMVPLAIDVTFKSQRLALITGTFLALQLLRRASFVQPRTFAVLVVGLVAADLSSAHRNLNLTTSWSELTTTPKLVDPDVFDGGNVRIFHYQQETSPTPEAPGQRVNGLEQWMSGPPWAGDVEDLNKLLWSSLFLNVTMIERVPSVGGGDGIQPSSNCKLQTALDLVDKLRAVRLLRAYSTAYLAGVGPLSIDALQEIRRSEQAPIFVYRMHDPLPRIRFVGRLRQAPDEREAFNLLASPDFGVESEAVVDQMPPDWHDDAESTTSAKISEARSDHERLFLRVSLQRRAFLVVNDSFFPGWQAAIDGDTTRVYRTNGLVRGVVVPAGEHVVEFRYRPDSWRRGVYISFTSLLFAGVLLVASLRAPRGRVER